MSSERGGLLKTRAETFARRLQTRLRSLNEAEHTWATEAGTSDNEVYYDIDSSLTSPEEELAEPIFIAEQNCNSLPLEQSDSSGSQYFDTVESFEEQPSPVNSVPSSKQIPILHLKTDRPAIITNGHTNLLDADSGCSRVHEMPLLELELETIEMKNIDKDCDSDYFLENNNTDKHIEEVGPDLQPYSFDVEVDTISAVDGAAEEISESTRDLTCIYCDIEQIKSTISNSYPENNISHEVDIRNGHSKTSQLENKLEKCFLEVSSNSGINSTSDYSSDNEEGVSLTDLLKVLKQEISSETEQKRDTLESKETENSDSSWSTCPSIEVRESSPKESGNIIVIEEDDELYDIDTKRKNFRRCSSLKSGKTPPGTPGRKKIVRFADVLGLDLADVKTFLDEVPTIPKSAYEDLHGIDLSSTPGVELPLGKLTVVVPQLEKILVPLFQQPSLQPNFLDRVREHNVCLENAFVSDSSLFAISGVVRVKNIAFHKTVYVRYSINSWSSFSDLQARYVSNSCDGFSDKFSFMLYAHTLSVGQRLEFAIRFHASGTQFWDSNGGVNYIFECTRAPPRTYIDPGVPLSPMETWASFY